MNRDLVFIEHVLDSIHAIEEFTKGLSNEQFISSRLQQSAVVRELEIIGEAVKNISADLKRKYPKVKWRDITATRDKVIHHYFGVDFAIVWDIVKVDLPDLKKEVALIKKKLIKDSSHGPNS